MHGARSRPAGIPRTSCLTTAVRATLLIFRCLTVRLPVSDNLSADRYSPACKRMSDRSSASVRPAGVRPSISRCLTVAEPVSVRPNVSAVCPYAGRRAKTDLCVKLRLACSRRGANWTAGQVLPASHAKCTLCVVPSVEPSVHCVKCQVYTVSSAKCSSKCTLCVVPSVHCV